MQWRKSFDPSLASTAEGRVLEFLATNLGLPRVIAALRLNPVGGLTRSPGRLDDCHEPVVVRASGS
jgi:hypothetical protein